MTTIFKVVGSGLGLWAVLLLWPGFLLFLISVLLAVTLHPGGVDGGPGFGAGPGRGHPRGVGDRAGGDVRRVLATPADDDR